MIQCKAILLGNWKVRPYQQVLQGCRSVNPWKQTHLLRSPDFTQVYQLISIYILFSKIVYEEMYFLFYLALHSLCEAISKFEKLKHKWIDLSKSHLICQWMCKNSLLKYRRRRRRRPLWPLWRLKGTNTWLSGLIAVYSRLLFEYDNHFTQLLMGVTYCIDFHWWFPCVPSALHHVTFGRLRHTQRQRAHHSKWDIDSLQMCTP